MPSLIRTTTRTIWFWSNMAPFYKGANLNLVNAYKGMQQVATLYKGAALVWVVLSAVRDFRIVTFSQPPPDSYAAFWTAPEFGIFDRYRIEREELDGSPISDIIRLSTITTWHIGDVRQRLRIRAENTNIGVNGPWSAWIS